MDLSTCPLFASLSTEEHATIRSIAATSAIESGGIVFRDGDAGDSLVVILAGTVRVSKQGPSGEEEELALLSSGSHFGEMALVGERRRSATCTAVERCEIATMPFPALEAICARDAALAAKIYRAIAASLARRVQRSNTSLTFLKGFLKAKG